MRPVIRFATTAARALRHVLPSDDAFAAGAAAAGNPRPLLEQDARRLAKPTAPRR
jgi:hypothetical protein